MTGLRWPRRRQLRTRVLVGVLGITVAALAAFDVAAVTELRSYLLGRTDALLQQAVTIAAPHIDTVLRRVQTGRPPGVLRGDFAQLYLAYHPDHGTTVVLETGPGLTPRLPDDLTAVAHSGQAQTVAGVGGQSLRLRAARAGDGILVVASDLHDVNITVDHLRLVVIIGSLAATALIAIGVLLLLRRGLRPLEAMAGRADRITAGDLDAVSYPADADTEVGRLGAALNGMLARIHASVAQREADQDLMRRFFADASHELRTPLASMRANAELYEQGALTQRADVDEAMRRISLEARRMTRLVDDMLRLARLDQHPEPQRARTDLTDLLTACLDRARVADPGRTWTSNIQPNLVAIGDAELLQRAVDNLLANVHAHAGREAAATLTATADRGIIRIEVSDAGPGVPATQLPRIFGRFYRADSSRHVGAGLGLAIVAEVAAQHGGTVHAEHNTPHGLRVQFTISSVEAGR